MTPRGWPEVRPTLGLVATESISGVRGWARAEELIKRLVEKEETDRQEGPRPPTGAPTP